MEEGLGFWEIASRVALVLYLWVPSVIAFLCFKSMLKSKPNWWQLALAGVGSIVIGVFFFLTVKVKGNV